MYIFWDPLQETWINDWYRSGLQAHVYVAYLNANQILNLKNKTILFIGGQDFPHLT